MPPDIIPLGKGLESLHRGVKVRNIRLMRDMSNSFTQDLLIYQDQLYLDLALASLVLAKMIEKPRFWKFEEWKKIVFGIEESLAECIQLAKKNEKREVRKIIGRILTTLSNVDRKDKRYVDSVLEQGRIKVGSTLYAQGLSLGKASELSGADKDSISRYAGRTLISDRFGKTYSITERIRNARGVFKN